MQKQRSDHNSDHLFMSPFDDVAKECNYVNLVLVTGSVITALNIYR